MPILKKIGNMQKQGLKEDEITQRLREEGKNPREINEAIDQNKVKSAVAPTEMEPSLMNVPENNIPMPTPGQQTEQPLSQEMNPPMPQGTAFPQEQMMDETQSMPLTQELPGSYEQEAYPQYQEYQPAQPLDTEMMAEVAEQLIDEKTAKLQKQMSEISRFTIEAKGKINNIDDRLRRMEMIIDKLQTSILGEIGNYGKNMADLKEEMQTTQDSFSKILNPLSENIEELRKITGSTPKAPKTTKTKRTRKKTKSKDDFENYLRD